MTKYPETLALLRKEIERIYIERGLSCSDIFPVDCDLELLCDLEKGDFARLTFTLSDLTKVVVDSTEINPALDMPRARLSTKH